MLQNIEYLLLIDNLKHTIKNKCLYNTYIIYLYVYIRFKYNIICLTVLYCKL